MEDGVEDGVEEGVEEGVEARRGGGVKDGTECCSSGVHLLRGPVHLDKGLVQLNRWVGAARWGGSVQLYRGVSAAR